MYFHMCLETVTEPALIQAFVKVLIVNDSKTRELNLLEVILSKMNSSERVCSHLNEIISPFSRNFSCAVWFFRFCKLSLISDVKT